jgi:uncharacterized protein
MAGICGQHAGLPDFGEAATVALRAEGRYENKPLSVNWGISEDDTAWRAAGRRQFDAAYAAGDSVYELLIQDTSTR